MTGSSYTVSGDPHNPAILFLHGFMGSGANWADLISTLDERFYCVAPDLPGHGSSLGLPPEAYSLEGAARTLLDLLDNLGAGRPTIAGYSMGGRLALYLALRHSEACSALFLESTSPGIEDAAGREARRRSDEEKAAQLEAGDLVSFLREWYRQPLFASLARRQALLRETIEARMRNDPGELARSLRGMGTGSQPSLWEELAQLEAPALAVAGELDEKYAAISTRMASITPRIRAAVVPDAGHNVRLEAPETYCAFLKHILDARQERKC
ncbi:MAG: 2-succinyl-6-hydroxy-2,4-cyclohexadiene-1-carboxylate synthase [Rubrobacteraceae bacterium]